MTGEPPVFLRHRAVIPNEVRDLTHEALSMQFSQRTPQRVGGIPPSGRNDNIDSGLARVQPGCWSLVLYPLSGSLRLTAASDRGKFPESR